MPLTNKTPAQLVTEIALAMYKPPLSEVKDREKQEVTELGVVLLFLDFDAEVQSNGMVGFLENPTGLFLRQTIEAFKIIGANRTAAVLLEIQKALQKHGTSPERLSQDVAGAKEFTISSFAQRHGPQLEAMVNEVKSLASTLFVSSPCPENPYQLIERYAGAHFDAIKSRLANVGGASGG